MSDEPSKAPAIHGAIRSAMRDIATTGIAKASQAKLGGANVNYRGVEAAMNEMSGVLIRNGITVTASYSDLAVVDRVRGEASEGKFTRLVTLRGAFTFASIEDGSSVRCEHYGEAMDTGDKAVTKAQSVAFRTALFQQFVVPTMAIDPESGGDGEAGEAVALTPEAFNSTVKALREAATMEDLRKVYEAASQAAQAADDRHAHKEFAAIKDLRKKELAGAAK